MTFWPFLHFFSFLIYVLLSLYVIYKNPRSPLNRVGSVLFLSFALWSFGGIFLHNPHATKETARLFENIAALGWCSFTSFFLWFIIIFTGKKALLKKKLLYFALFIPPVIFLYKQWTNFLITDYISRPYGYSGVWSTSIWPYIYYVYFFLFFGISFYLLGRFFKETDSPLMKKRVAIIYLTTVFSLVLGSITDIILPRLNAISVPDIADVFGLIWAFGIIYAIARYKFLAITPSNAAENIISTMTDCLILLDDKGSITTVNKATLELLRYSRSDLEGAPVARLIIEGPEKWTILQKISKGKGISDHDHIFRAKGDRPVQVIFSSSVLWDGSGNIVGTVCILKDITDRKSWEDNLQHARDELEERVKVRTADLITANEQLQKEIAQREKIDKTLHESQEKYSTLVEKGNDAIIIIQDGVVKFANSKMKEFTGIEVDRVIGRSFLEFVCPDSQKLAAERYKRRMAGEEVPNRYEINVITKDGKHIPVEVSASLIEYEGRSASMSIIRDMTKRKQTEEELKRSYKQLERVIENIINAMASIVEARDPYTAGHQARVAELASALAEEMGLKGERVKGIRMAAFIHDIGKISVPGEILSKPGRLSEYELGLIKAHAQMGYDILKNIEFPWPIAQIVLQHHERINGSGYPQGIFEKKLLLDAEILSIADVVEAMTSHRPYRPALGLDKALEEITQKRGTLYRPDVVDACLRLFNEKGFKI
ncbi:MAG: PAS domain S-box protein [Candidatus Omnitrophica bacterium]|nr:PAS domain S-box protein [Candidatus Omnitrophota bacterium]